MARRNLAGVGAVVKLEGLGFRLVVDEDGQINYSRHADWELAAEAVRPYLEALKADKAAAMEFLKDRQAKHEAWLAAYEAWEKDPDPSNDTTHKQRIAETAGAAGLPFYEDGENDAGAGAWIRWAGQAKEHNGEIA